MNRFEEQAYLNSINNNFFEMIDNFNNNFDTSYNQMYIKEKNDYILSTSPNIDNCYTTNHKDSMLFSAHEGFEKGNMFKNLYEQYKNYKPKDLNPRDEREQALLQIDQLSFAMHEINLYLNIFPDDINMINKYNEFQRNYNQILNYYESRFAPIQTNNEFMTTSPFAWTADPWPWDRRDF